MMPLKKIPAILFFYYYWEDVTSRWSRLALFLGMKKLAHAAQAFLAFFKYQNNKTEQDRDSGVVWLGRQAGSRLLHLCFLSVEVAFFSFLSSLSLSLFLFHYLLPPHLCFFFS